MVDTGTGREPTLLTVESSASFIDEEIAQRTALRTLYCNQVARAVFFISHGLLIVTVSSSAQLWPKVPWRVVFLPAWIGNCLCICTLILSWFVSCPYVKLCMAEKQPRIGLSNPSILTEVLPDIVLSIAGVAFLILLLTSEVVLCQNMEHGQAIGQMYISKAVLFLFSLVAVLAVCHGTCTLYNSSLFVIVGAGLFFTVITAGITCCQSGSPVQALALLPPAFAVACLLGSAIHRLAGIRHVLSRMERQLHAAEVFLMASLMVAILACIARTASDGFAKVQLEGNASGILVCLLALLRCWLSHLEVKNAPLMERLLATPVPSNSARTVRLSDNTTGPAEVQISIRESEA